MKEALKKQIEEVLPELENALVKAGDIVVVNGVSIERFEAVRQIRPDLDALHLRQASLGVRLPR